MTVTLSEIMLYVFLTLFLLLLILYIGLQVRPKSFARYPAAIPPMQTVPLPLGLPAPVERYYRVTVGDEIPYITSAVLSGRADLRIQGVRFRSLWRFTHLAGRDYRHYIEATLFGRPLMRVNELYLDGKSRLELPMGTLENDPKTDSAANLGLWGETVFLPSVFLTDRRVRWEPEDMTTARLVVPFGEVEDSFTVRFDAESGLIRCMEAMRWKAPTSMEKTNWLLEPLAWDRFHGILLPSRFAITWADDRQPWLVGTLEEVVYNVDVGECLKSKGP